MEQKVFHVLYYLGNISLYYVRVLAGVLWWGHNHKETTYYKDTNATSCRTSSGHCSFKHLLVVCPAAASSKFRDVNIYFIHEDFFKVKNLGFPHFLCIC